MADPIFFSRRCTGEAEGSDQSDDILVLYAVARDRGTYPNKRSFDLLHSTYCFRSKHNLVGPHTAEHSYYMNQISSTHIIRLVDELQAAQFGIGGQ